MSLCRSLFSSWYKAPDVQHMNTWTATEHNTDRWQRMSKTKQRQEKPRIKLKLCIWQSLLLFPVSWPLSLQFHPSHPHIPVFSAPPSPVPGPDVQGPSVSVSIPTLDKREGRKDRKEMTDESRWEKEWNSKTSTHINLLVVTQTHAHDHSLIHDSFTHSVTSQADWPIRGNGKLMYFLECFLKRLSDTESHYQFENVSIHWS